MPSHRLKIDLQGGRLIVSCECGQWHEERVLQAMERPSEVMQELEKEYEKHVAAAGGTP